MRENIVKSKSFVFDIRFVKLYQFLVEIKKKICFVKTIIEKWHKHWCNSARKRTRLI